MATCRRGASSGSARNQRPRAPCIRSAIRAFVHSRDRPKDTNREAARDLLSCRRSGYFTHGGRRRGQTGVGSAGRRLRQGAGGRRWSRVRGPAGRHFRPGRGAGRRLSPRRSAARRLRHERYATPPSRSKGFRRDREPTAAAGGGRIGRTVPGTPSRARPTSARRTIPGMRRPGLVMLKSAIARTPGLIPRTGTPRKTRRPIRATAGRARDTMGRRNHTTIPHRNPIEGSPPAGGTVESPARCVDGSSRSLTPRVR